MKKIFLVALSALIFMPLNGLAQDRLSSKADAHEFRNELFSTSHPTAFKSNSNDPAISSAGLTFADEYYLGGFSYAQYAVYTEGTDIYVGGAAQYVGQTQINGISRNVGFGWEPMASGFNGSVTSIIRFDGNLIAAGGFTQTGNGAPVKGVAYWNGFDWQQLGAGHDGFVYALHEYDGKLYIGVQNGVLVWDGVEMTRLFTSNGYVDSFTEYDDILWMGGTFTQVEGNDAPYIVYHDGEGLHLPDFVVNGQVRSLTTYDNRLIVGGFFNQVDGTPTPPLFQFDGATVSEFPDTPTFLGGGVLSLNTFGDNLLITGNFRTDFNNFALEYNGTDWVHTGYFSTTVWDASITSNDLRIYVGNFAEANFSNYSYIAAHDGDFQQFVPNMPVTTPGKGVPGDVFAIDAIGTTVGIGGFFGNLGPDRAATFSIDRGNDWENLGGFNSTVETVRFYASNWYVGGHFTFIGSEQHNRIAKFNGTEWEQMGKGLNGFVLDIGIIEGQVVAVGAFTATDDGSVELNRIARWDGFNWHPYGDGFNNLVRNVHWHNGELYAAGQFYKSGNDDVVGVARWTGEKWVQVGDPSDPIFTEATFPLVFSLTTYNNKLVAGRSSGGFSAGGPGSVHQLIDGNWVSIDQSIFGNIYDMLQIGGSLYFAGDFNANDGAVRNLATWDGDVISPLGNPNRTVYSLARTNTSLYAAGIFDKINNAPSVMMARIDGFVTYPIWAIVNDSFVQSGDTIEVNIRVGQAQANFTDLYGVGFRLHYNTDVFTFIDATKGEFLGEDSIIEFINTDTEGEVAMALTRTSGPGVDGNGRVAVLRFRVDANQANLQANFGLTEYEAVNSVGAYFELEPNSPVFSIYDVVVYPGDTNNDGIVNQDDILPIGQYFGETGPARPNATLQWMPQPIERWTAPETIPEAMYADASGDGRINQNDILPVGVNFGRMQGQFKQANILSDPITTIDLPAGDPGTLYRVSVELDHEVANPFILGVAGRVVLDMEMLEMVNVMPSSLLAATNMITYVNENDQTGEVSFALTRRNSDGPIEASGELYTFVFESHVALSDPITLPFLEAAYSTMTEIVKNPRLKINVAIITSIPDDGVELPRVLTLDQNYPNPFNPTTSIRYHLPEAAAVDLRVFDMLGREVASLVNSDVSAGSHTVSFDASNLSSGMYIYRLQTGTEVITRKMILVK